MARFKRTHGEYKSKHDSVCELLKVRIRSTSSRYRLHCQEVLVLKRELKEIQRTKMIYSDADVGYLISNMKESIKYHGGLAEGCASSLKELKEKYHQAYNKLNGFDPDQQAQLTNDRCEFLWL